MRLQFSNWLRAVTDNADAAVLNTKARDIVALLPFGATQSNVQQNIRTNKPFHVLVKQPDGSILALHHVSVLGGSIANPDAQIIALAGKGHHAQGVRINVAEALAAINVTLPNQNRINSADTKELLANLAPPDTRPSRLQSLAMLAVPPAVEAIVMDAPSSNASDLFLHVKARVRAIDVAADVEGADSLETATRTIVHWLWAAQFDTFPTVSSMPITDDLGSAWVQEMHKESIQPDTATPPGTDPITDGTMRSVARNLTEMTEKVEDQNRNHIKFEETRIEQKNHWHKYPPSAQTTYLNLCCASTDREPPKDPTEFFKELLSLRTVSLGSTHLYEDLRAEYTFPIVIETNLVTSLFHGRWRWSQADYPSNFTLFSLGDKSAESTKSDRERTKMQTRLLVQSDEGVKLQEGQLEFLTSENILVPDGVKGLTRKLKLGDAVLTRIFGKDAYIRTACTSWLTQIEGFESNYEHAFERDSALPLKIMYCIDFGIQRFIHSCARAKSVADIDFNQLNFADDQSKVLRGQFVQDLPSSLVTAIDDRKRDLDHEPSGGPSPEKKRSRPNKTPWQHPAPNPEWILRSDEPYGSVFNDTNLANCPSIRLPDGSSQPVCNRAQARGFCFSNCKRYHGALLGDDRRAYGTFNQECRQAYANGTTPPPTNPPRGGRRRHRSPPRDHTTPPSAATTTTTPAQE